MKTNKTKPKPTPKNPNKAPSAGALLRDARIRSGLTQNEVAKKTGMMQNRISAVESSANVQWTTFCLIATACGHTVTLQPTAKPKPAKPKAPRPKPAKAEGAAVAQ